jgi:hypothetical protein
MTDSDYQKFQSKYSNNFKAEGGISSTDILMRCRAGMGKAQDQLMVQPLWKNLFLQAQQWRQG